MLHYSSQTKLKLSKVLLRHSVDINVINDTSYID